MKPRTRVMLALAPFEAVGLLSIVVNEVTRWVVTAAAYAVARRNRTDGT